MASSGANKNNNLEISELFTEDSLVFLERMALAKWNQSSGLYTKSVDVKDLSEERILLYP